MYVLTLEKDFFLFLIIFRSKNNVIEKFRNHFFLIYDDKQYFDDFDKASKYTILSIIYFLYSIVDF